MKKPLNERVALITGVTGQDGSYLAELLLEKGYKKVVGLRRRTSVFNTARIEHIYNHPNFIMEWGNMTDTHSLWRIITKYQPDEIYNLAAQSHVKVSFDVPEETLDVVAGGTLKLLNVCKEVLPTARIYQASSSEMYGDNTETPQNETTRMTPASPYACAKLYAHNLCRNYREGYGMHISCGILFNHETVAGFMPVIFKEGKKGAIDIKPIQEVVINHTKKSTKAIDLDKEFYQEVSPEKTLYVWDKNGWTQVTYASGYPHKATNYSKNPQFVVTPKGAVFATDTHEHIMAKGKDKPFREIEIGDQVSLVNNLPSVKNKKSNVTNEEAYILGHVVVNGTWKNSKVKITHSTKSILQKVANYWGSLGRKFTLQKNSTKHSSNSGPLWTLLLKDADEWIENRMSDLYTDDLKRRVPKAILNSDKSVQKAFLAGAIEASSSQSKHGIKFRTDSATLSLGLIYLTKQATKKNFVVDICETNNTGGYEYEVTLFDDEVIAEQDDKSRLTLRLNSQSAFVKNKIEKPFYDGWFFDLETKSNTFHCGVGLSHVHNSPRRGETFVTRKITKAAARIKLGKQDILELGNLDAKRDWGYAKDFCYGIWLMLQQDKPDDYVLATGETHTVREFLQEVFSVAKLDIDKHVRINEKYFRPHEVPLLLGDASKAREKLGWEPKVKFKELAKIMYEADFDAELGL